MNAVNNAADAQSKFEALMDLVYGEEDAEEVE